MSEKIQLWVDLVTLLIIVVAVYSFTRSTNIDAEKVRNEEMLFGTAFSNLAKRAGVYCVYIIILVGTLYSLKVVSEL